MRLQTKLSLFFILFSFFIVIPITTFIIFENKNIVLEQDRHTLEQVSKRISHYMNGFLSSKVDSTLTLSTAPIIKDFLLRSNSEFKSLNEKDRYKKINKLNEQWKLTNNKSAFIQAYLTNELASYFKSQQELFKNTYGEIFLTNKYGALVSSTGKLTTYSHKNKYWWKGSYNEGKGQVYLDDRGFDKSVQGYVIGIVVPIFYKKEIIGILKANLNIEGSISNILKKFRENNTGDIEIVRSKGLIVYKEGIEPLSQMIEPDVKEAFLKNKNGAIIKNNKIIAFSKINIDHDSYEILFSGKPKTIDNVKGNKNESWFIVIREDINDVYKLLENIIEVIIVATLLFLLLSLIIGRFLAYYITKPLKRLILNTKNFTKGNEVPLLDNNSSDEVGQLTTSFNKMSETISITMKSKNKLLKKINRLKKEYESTINETNLVSKTDIKGCITYVNKAFCDTLGYKEDELIGKNHSMHKDPSIKSDYYKELWNTILSGKVWTGITTNISKNGTLLHLHTSIFPILDDNNEIVEFIAMRFNITNEVKLKEALKLQNKELEVISKRLNTAQNIAKIGSYEFNIETNNVLWSDEHFRILNEEVQSFKPNFETYLSYVHPDDIEKVKSYLNNTISLKEFIRFDYRVVLKNGQIKYVESTSDVVAYSLDKKPLLIAGTMLDITDRVNKEIEIEEKNKILFHQSKMSTMGEMLGNIAHQWRQPLSVISTIATGTSLRKELNSLDDEEFYSSMNNINTSVQYLSKTIDDFRNFFDPNKLESYFYIKSVFNKTFTLINTQFKNKNIELVVDIDDIELFGLENELLQVLINILNNARDAFENKDIARKLIIISVSNKNSETTIEIKDNAGGVKADIINKIFEPYFTTKHQSQGTGIGLYMSKEIIEKHMHGSINVINTGYTYQDLSCKGANFIIKLPLELNNLNKQV